MPTVPVVPTPTGGVWNSSQLAALSAAVSFLMGKPAAELRQTVAQSIPNAVWTAFTFTVEDLDSDPSGGSGGHDNATNTSRWTCVYTGWYRTSGGGELAVNATGQRGVAWAVNGTLVNASRTMVSATAAVGMDVPARTKLIFLITGDYVELQTWQNSGGALNTFITAEAASGMSIVWERNA